MIQKIKELVEIVTTVVIKKIPFLAEVNLKGALVEEIVDFIAKGKNVDYDDMLILMVHAPGCELYLLYHLAMMIDIDKALYSRVAIESYWRYDYNLELDLRLVFDPKLFNANLGMNQEELDCLNSIRGTVVYRDAKNGEGNDLTWMTGLKDYPGYKNRYCVIMEAQVYKSNILFCRKGDNGIEVVAFWKDIFDVSLFEVN